MEMSAVNVVKRDRTEPDVGSHGHAAEAQALPEALSLSCLPKL